MAAPNATRRPGGGGAAAVIDLDEQITAEDSSSTTGGQAITLPTLADARARLIEVIRQKPAPAPALRYWTAADEARMARRCRLSDAQRRLATIRGNVTVATAMGVSARTICHWRAGTRHPSVRLWRRLRALYTLVVVGGRP